MDGWIYFANPTSFNDPFEMSAVAAAPTKEAFLRLIEGVGDASVLTKSAKSKIYARVSEQLALTGAKPLSDEWMQLVGVLCLTTKPLDVLMWAHYASNHTGVCIGFDGAFEPFNSADEVFYSDERPQIPTLEPSRDGQKLVRAVLLTKSMHWRYESEWRCVKRPMQADEISYYRELLKRDPSKLDPIANLLASEGGAGPYQFDTAAIRRVYFGARVVSARREEIMSALRLRDINAKVFQIELDSRYYWLNKKRLDK
ncbi:MAG: DUF2971 domain-containing protein [Gallionella sp.]|nr:DUF2971 domain-containing protein [Gallionella sp.]